MKPNDCGKHLRKILKGRNVAEELTETLACRVSPNQEPSAEK